MKFNFYRKKKAEQKEEDTDEIKLETALEMEERYKKEASNFPYAVRVPAESEKNNFKSMNRILDGKIILLVKND